MWHIYHFCADISDNLGSLKWHEVLFWQLNLSIQLPGFLPKPSSILCSFTHWVCSAQFDYLLQAVIKSFWSHEFMEKAYKIKTFPNLKSLR